MFLVRAPEVSLSVVNKAAGLRTELGVEAELSSKALPVRQVALALLFPRVEFTALCPRCSSLDKGASIGSSALDLSTQTGVATFLVNACVV